MMPSRPLLAAAIAACLVLFASRVGSTKRPRGKGHVVQSGQTLWGIAKQHDCSVKELQRANQLKGSTIYAGQRLVIPRCGTASRQAHRGTSRRANRPGRGQVSFHHTVESGDTLIAIAQRYNSRVEDIKRRNRLRSNTIYPGQELRIVLTSHSHSRDSRDRGSRYLDRSAGGQSIGAPQHGALVAGIKLASAETYYIRRPERVWGTTSAIEHTRRAIARVSRRYPKIHRLAIGDISDRRGGPLDGHRSHQSGRDVDLGLYFKRSPTGYPKAFIAGSARTLHLGATWLLIKTLADTAHDANGVERIFFDYDLQGIVYDYALDAGVPSDYLDAMFQYPHGRDVSTGVIRHEPNHADHIHVRFKCAADPACR